MDSSDSECMLHVSYDEELATDNDSMQVMNKSTLKNCQEYVFRV